jgi:hypothetical protein
MAEQGSGSGSVVLAIGAAAAAYFFWPQIAAALGIQSTPPTAAAPPTPGPIAPPGAQLTNNSPTTVLQQNSNVVFSNLPPLPIQLGPACIAGSTPVGNVGCCAYNNVISCPPGITPPAGATPTDNCLPGYTIDAAGVCVEYSDAQLIGAFNSIPWSGLTNIPAEQIARIDPQILTQYASTVGVNPGTVLAYMLGLGGAAAAGTTTTGSDGNLYTYTVQNEAGQSVGFWLKQSAGALKGVPGGRISRIGAALPITNNTLIEASHNPDLAAILGNHPAALLTVPQWNYFYTQASGIVQRGPQHPAGEPGARVNAATYQAIRRAAGMPARKLPNYAGTTLGTIRRSAPGAFPLGSIKAGPMRVPFVTPGNHTIYRIPGRGSVVGRVTGASGTGRMGLITDGGGNHRWERSPFPRKANWRRAE